MKKTVYVVGHKNPDSDSICSAIGLAYFMNSIDKTKKYIPKRTGELDSETKFILKTFKIKPPTLIKDLKNKEVILVDHNNFEDSIKGIEKANIVGVIDHHRISGDVKKDKAIMFETEVIGSTCSIVTEKFFSKNLKIPKEIAGVLLGGVLSDTILLKSPDTQKIDKLIAIYLSKKSGIDYKKFGKELIKKNTTEIKKSNIKKLLKSDLKFVKIKNIKIGISSIQVNREYIINRHNKFILDEMENLRRRLKLNTLFLMCVNIKEFKTTLLVSGDVKPYKKLYDKNHELILKDTVSRKSQIYPLLVNHIKEYLECLGKQKKRKKEKNTKTK